MSFFGLDSEKTIARINAAAVTPHIPSFVRSLSVSALGFCLVSLASFSAWAFGGRFFYAHIGEVGLYAVCALLFVGLTGYVLHRLVIGPGSLGRFYKLFTVAFGAYAVAWCVAWFSLRGKQGEWMGSLAGTLLMAVVLANAFSAPRAAFHVATVLFITHSAGYFTGGYLYELCKSPAALESFGHLLGKGLWREQE